DRANSRRPHDRFFRPRRRRRGAQGRAGMTALWTIDDMAKAMGAEKSGALPNAVPGLSIDSRGLAKGEAFFAIKGDNRDGHDFVAAALKAGAGAAVIVRDQRRKFSTDAPLLIVPDVLGALRDLARAARARVKAKVIAVTGSVGKTHAGEITPLTKLVRPHVAIVTAIEPVHLEYFGSLEKIADAKEEIFSG